MIQRIAIFILTSLIIGNTIAWFSGAAPIDFKLIPFNETETAQLVELRNELSSQGDDVDSLVLLGSMYSLHNEIDEAKPLLEKAISLEPENTLAQAWYWANETKLSGAMFDPLMGLYKLHKLQTALDAIQNVAQQAPDDVSVRLIRLTTFAFVGSINSHFEQVFSDEDWFNQWLNGQQSQLPADLTQSVYVALSQAYLVKFEQGDQSALEISQAYFNKSKQVGECPTNLTQECSNIVMAYKEIGV